MTLFRTLLLCLCVTTWIACGEPPATISPANPPCLGDNDCPVGSSCQGGTCVNTGASSEQTVVTSDASESTTDKRTELAPDAAPGEGTPPEGVPPELSFCIKGETRPCLPGGGDASAIQGECQPGTQTCGDDNLWGACVGGAGPKKDICNGLDDNCDGAVDEDFRSVGTTCYKGKGVCRTVGSFTCTADGSDVECNAPEPQTSTEQEVCDGKDNDCDGEVDELPKSSCKVPGKQGPCATGEQICVSGQFVCVQQVFPTGKETCNGKDDDCDGLVDNGFQNLGNSCTAGKGACAAVGKIVCTQDGTKTECNAKPGQPTPNACDGVDNDCDGIVDKGCSCKDNDTRSCYTDALGCTKQADGTYTCVGECAAGFQTCKGGNWDLCKGEAKSGSEVCDGKDNNCNGQTDEGNPEGGKPCSVSAAKGECKSGQEVCQGGTLVCESIYQPSAEICDGKDNDCDGQIDNGITSGTKDCVASSAKGECSRGKEFCNNGKFECRPSTPQKEICDGKDNDCDGRNDNDTTGAACKVPNLKGLCAEGQQTCVNGVFACVQKNSPQSEKCNKKDDDCDGYVDERLYCQPGQTRCNSLRTEAQVCNSDCTGYQRKDGCNVFGREYCISGKCVTCGCSAGSWRCKDRRWEQCTISDSRASCYWRRTNSGCR